MPIRKEKVRVFVELTLDIMGKLNKGALNYI